MGKWIAFIVLLISGSLLGYFYYELERTSLEVETATTTLPIIPKTSGIRLFHSYKDGIHRYTGEVKLPHSCYSLDTQVRRDPKDPTSLVVVLTSTDRMLEQRLCSKIQTGYSFEAVVETPDVNNLNVTLLLDGNDVPFHIVETQWQGAQGTILTTPPLQ